MGLQRGLRSQQPLHHIAQVLAAWLSIAACEYDVPRVASTLEAGLTSPSEASSAPNVYGLSANLRNPLRTFATRVRKFSGGSGF